MGINAGTLTYKFKSSHRNGKQNRNVERTTIPKSLKLVTEIRFFVSSTFRQIHIINNRLKRKNTD